LVTVASSTAKRRPEGMISFRISSLFASSSALSMLTPVVLPPGLAKPPISPLARRSAFATIGIVLVACCAARIAGGPMARMTLAFARTSDWASSGNRSIWSSALPDLEADVAAIDQPEGRQRILEPRGERLGIVRRVVSQDADDRQVFVILRKCREGSA
jgi:hypothetical protein